MGCLSWQKSFESVSIVAKNAINHIFARKSGGLSGGCFMLLVNPKTNKVECLENLVLELQPKHDAVKLRHKNLIEQIALKCGLM